MVTIVVQCVCVCVVLFNVACFQQFIVDAVWSYGVVVWEIFANQRPWAGATPAIAAHKTLSGERLAIDEHWPEPVRAVMHGCWRDEPKQRLTTEQISVALKRYDSTYVVGPIAAE
jgi:hypothetical protein